MIILSCLFLKSWFLTYCDNCLAIGGVSNQIICYYIICTNYLICLWSLVNLRRKYFDACLLGNFLINNQKLRK